MPTPVREVYLDAATCEPLLPQARQAWLAAHDAGWADPGRLHRPGRAAAQALERAAEVVADATGARADEVVFTGPGAQGCVAALTGLIAGRTRVGPTVVATAVEHSTVLAAAADAGELHTVAVDRLGRVDLAAWAAAVRRPGVAAAVIQVANHEVGTVQPYREACELGRSAGVPVVVDATHALGRLPLDPEAPWSALTGPAAAFGGPVSTGLMVVRHGARWRAPYVSDDYQRGRWPGPPDVAGAVSAAVALETWLADPDTSQRQHGLIHRLRQRLPEQIADLDVAGDPDRRAPHLLTFSVLYTDGETLTLELDRAGFAVASGSACSASSQTPSHVLAAMGALTHGNIRIGLTRTTTEADVDALLVALPPIVTELRGRVGLA